MMAVLRLKGCNVLCMLSLSMRLRLEVLLLLLLLQVGSVAVVHRWCCTATVWGLDQHAPAATVSVMSGSITSQAYRRLIKRWPPHGFRVPRGVGAKSSTALVEDSNHAKKSNGNKHIRKPGTPTAPLTPSVSLKSQRHRWVCVCATCCEVQRPRFAAPGAWLVGSTFCT